MIPAASATEEGEEECEHDAQDDRRRQRKVKADTATPHVDIAGQASERQAKHDEQAEGGNAQTDQDERSTHKTPFWMEGRSIYDLRFMHRRSGSNQINPSEKVPD